MIEAGVAHQGFESNADSNFQFRGGNPSALLMARYRAEVEKFLALPFCQDAIFSQRNPAAWEGLESFSFTQLQETVENFADYVAVCEEVAQICAGEFRNKQAVWSYLKRRQLVPSSTLMGKISESEVIEIFDLRGNQIFRNIHYFRVSSYTFEDLMHFPVNMLYRRDPKIGELLMQEVGTLLSGNLRSEFNSSVPAHEVSEIRSTKLFSSIAEQRLLAPLFNSQGQVAAVLATVDIQIQSAGLRRESTRPALQL